MGRCRGRGGGRAGGPVTGSYQRSPVVGEMVKGAIVLALTALVVMFAICTPELGVR